MLLGTAPAQLQLQAPGLPASESIQWTLQTVHLVPGGDVVFGPARAFTVLGD
ncbi:MAG: hypothetical protein AAF726_23615 [Planctomycetota bacterium]